MRNANKAIGRTRYPTPTVDDLQVKLAKASRFSKLDLNNAFHQLELEESSRYITAFQTEDRIKQFKCLSFGINSASEELQHALRELLADIDGATNIADDILIYGVSENDHDNILSKVLERLSSRGVTLNLNKCVFDKLNLEYFGYIFSASGMRPSESKVQALKQMSQPESPKDVHSFLGLTNYLKRFINNYSTITHPLRELTKKNSEFKWTAECEQSFSHLVSVLTKETIISYFDENKETILFCDASPVGVSSILAQRKPESKEYDIVSYSSRALTDTEKRYSQIERECLGIVYACGEKSSILTRA